jgi:hypothetical protein
MQLVAYGAQDIYLTGNPQITFFKVVYRRHTNFAMESICQTFNGAVDFGKKASCTIARNGDLVTKMYLEVTFNSFKHNYGVIDGEQYNAGKVAKDCFMKNLGNGLVRSVECEIGGQCIDKQYGEWMDIWAQLSEPGYGNASYHNMVTTDSFSDYDENGDSLRLFVPLQFWFCNNPGLALPLIALQYHEVKINLHVEDLLNVVTFNGVKNLGNKVNDLSIGCCNLFCDYIYLDTDERRRFAQVSHEYLIQQVQFSGANSVSKNITDTNISLDLNHPVKELVWVVENDPHLESTQINSSYPVSSCRPDPEDRFKWLNGTSDMCMTDQTESAVLQLNGHDRFQRRVGRYFKWVQKHQHHSNHHTEGENNIYLYSFALKPEEHQPSGTCNFSRIDSANLNLSLYRSRIGNKEWVEENLENETVDRKVRVYATNYNVLRVMSGMGGLAYSN